MTVQDATFKRIRAALCEFSTIPDLDEYAAFVTREVLIAKAKAKRKKVA